MKKQKFPLPRKGELFFLLLKEPAERSKKERETLKSSAVSREIGTLSLEKRAIIRRELVGQARKTL